MAVGDRPRYDLRSLSDIIKRAITMSLRNPHVLFLNFQAMAIRSSMLGCLIFFLGFLKGLGWFFSQCGVSTYGAVSFFYSITKINADILGHLSLTRQHRPERCVISVYNVSSTRPSRNLSLSPPQTTFYGSYSLHESLQVVSRMVPLGQ